MTTQIHDSTTCTAGVNGGKCEMCQFVENSARERLKWPSDAPLPENWQMKSLAPESKNAPQVKYGSGITISAPDFEHEWREAPEIRRRYFYQEDAFYWFMRGVRCGELNQMIEENRVFRQMAELRGLL